LGDHVLLALARQEGVDWILELKAFLVSSKLPKDESEAGRIMRRPRDTVSKMVTCTSITRTTSL
jgi:hypothetical protein